MAGDVPPIAGRVDRLVHSNPIKVVKRPGWLYLSVVDVMYSQAERFISGFLISTLSPPSAVRWDAIDDDAKRFCERYGLLELTDSPLHLFFPVAFVRRLIA